MYEFVNIDVTFFFYKIITFALDPLQANMCLAQAVVPKKTTDDGKSVIEEKKTVAQIAFLECCEGKDLYFFPGIDLVPIPKGFENKDFSESGRPVCAPSSENPH